MTNTAFVIALTEQELNNKVEELLQNGRISRVVRIYTSKTSLSLKKDSYIAEVEVEEA